jgi:hypothetical protein
MSKAIARDPIYRRRRFQPEIIELCGGIFGDAFFRPEFERSHQGVLGQFFCDAERFPVPNRTG